MSAISIYRDLRYFIKLYQERWIIYDNIILWLLLRTIYDKIFRIVLCTTMLWYPIIVSSISYRSLLSVLPITISDILLCAYILLVSSFVLFIQ